MHYLMWFQVVFLGKAFPTKSTNVWFFSGMYPLMYRKIITTSYILSTISTWKPCFRRRTISTILIWFTDTASNFRLPLFCICSKNILCNSIINICRRPPAEFIPIQSSYWLKSLEIWNQKVSVEFKIQKKLKYLKLCAFFMVGK